MKKILVVAPRFHPYVGGLERYVEELYSRLAQTGRYEVHVLTVADEGKRHESYRGLHVHRVRSAFSIGSVFVVPVLSEWNKVLNGFLRDGSFDCVNTHTRFFATSYLAARAARKLGVFHVHTEHGASAVVHSSILIRLGSKFFDAVFGRYVMKNADKVVAISQAGVAFCRSMGAKNVVYVPNGIDSLFWRPAKQRPDAAGGPLDIVYVGRMMEAKGVRYLLEAVQSLTVPWRLVMVGAGELLKELQDSQADERIVFTGSLEAKEVRDRLRQADIFVNPSLNEGLPTVVLEAMATGVPAVATDVGGTKEILARSTEASRLVPPAQAEALATAISDLAAQICQAGGIGGEELHKRIAQEYGWDGIVTRIKAVFS